MKSSLLGQERLLRLYFRITPIQDKYILTPTPPLTKRDGVKVVRKLFTVKSIPNSQKGVTDLKFGDPSTFTDNRRVGLVSWFKLKDKIGTKNHVSNFFHELY